MSGSLKLAMLGALFAGLAAVFLVSELGIELYPPTWSQPGGQWGYYEPVSIRSCMGARALSNLADNQS